MYCGGRQQLTLNLSLSSSSSIDPYRAAVILDLKPVHPCFKSKVAATSQGSVLCNKAVFFAQKQIVV